MIKKLLKSMSKREADQFMPDQPNDAPTDQSARPPAESIRQAKSLRLLAPDTRDALFSIAERMSCKAGDLIIKEGDRGKEFYIVEQGHVVGFRADDEAGTEWSTARLGPGEVLGWRTWLE